MADSIARRLMYLCDLSYVLPLGEAVAVPVRGDVEVRRRDQAIGLLEPVCVVGRNLTGIYPRDVAIVGHIAEGIVIAFRGTQPPDPNATGNIRNAILKDWLNDGAIFDPATAQFPDRVHGGFAAATVALCAGQDGVKARLEALLARPDVPKRIFVTGHSKGGPLANLTAWLIRAKWGISSVPVSVVTFAAARTGNAAFRADYNSRGINCTRYEAAFDQVPNLPLGSDKNDALAALLRGVGIAIPADGIGFVGIGKKTEENFLAAIQLMWELGLHNLADGIDFKDALPLLVKAHSIMPGLFYDHLVK